MTETSISGVRKLSFDSFEEVRGNIWTTYKASEFMQHECLANLNFIHDKFSISNYNVFRGFHGDEKSTKLVTCVYGEITQFVLDYREHSKTFGMVKSFEIGRDQKYAI